MKINTFGQDHHFLSAHSFGIDRVNVFVVDVVCLYVFVLFFKGLSSSQMSKLSLQDIPFI